MVEQRKHVIKAWPEYFERLWDRTKPFELRKNDRDYRVGDRLNIVEFDPETGTRSGRMVMADVTYLIDQSRFGLAEGHCILGLRFVRAGDPENLAWNAKRDAADLAAARERIAALEGAAERLAYSAVPMEQHPIYGSRPNRYVVEGEVFRLLQAALAPAGREGKVANGDGG
jgi:hypothetical protein